MSLEIPQLWQHATFLYPTPHRDYILAGSALIPPRAVKWPRRYARKFATEISTSPFADAHCQLKLLILGYFVGMSGWHAEDLDEGDRKDVATGPAGDYWSTESSALLTASHPGEFTPRK